MTTFHGKLPYRGLPRARRREHGLTLIELMISITLGLLILAGMVTVFANTSFVRSEIERTSRQIENGRYAIELLKEDIQLAGYFGETNMKEVLLTLPGAIPDPCSVVLAEWQGAMKLHVQGVNDYNSAAPVPENLACLPNVKAGTDVIIIRRAKTCVAGSAGCDPITNGKPYLQVPLCSLEIITHTLDLKAAGNFNVHQLKGTDPATCLPAVLAPLRPYVVYFYYVDGTDNTLKRAEFTGSAIGNITALVDGIEDLQFDYGLDTSIPGDGAADLYQAAAPTMTVADWTNVMTVQVTLLARNLEVSPGYTDTKIYNLGPSKGDLPAFNDGRRRHVYSALVRIQNASGRRETP